MLDSYTATSVLIGFLIIFGVIIPILDKTPKIRDFISLRWVIVVIYSAMGIGVILDFNHLDNSARFVVLIGGIILAVLFVLVRSIEKIMSNGWSLPSAKAKISKGDISAELSLEQEKVEVREQEEVKEEVKE